MSDICRRELQEREAENEKIVRQLVLPEGYQILNGDFLLGCIPLSIRQFISMTLRSIDLWKCSPCCLDFILDMEQGRQFVEE